jgi:hypothetical protein
VDLIRVAGDLRQETGIRYFTLHAALEVGGRSSADGVSELLSDLNPGIRCLAVMGIGEMQDPELVGRLKPLLRDHAMVVRECALTAVVRAQGDASKKIVLRVISDPANYVHGHALSIIKRSFELLDAMGSGSAKEACDAFKAQVTPAVYTSSQRQWSVCAAGEDTR